MRASSSSAPAPARDAIWLPSRGTTSRPATTPGRPASSPSRAAKKAGVPLQWQFYNLESTYSTLTGAARLAHEPGPKHVYARLLVDALDPEARASLWRFCSMVGRSGGRTFLEFRTAESRREPKFFGPHIRTYARVPVIEAEIAARGGTVARQDRRAAASRRSDKEDPVVCRMEVSWT